MKKPRQRDRRASSGQAVIEFVIMLSMSVSVVAATAIIFRQTIMAMWVSLAKDISAACPGCPPDTSVR
jgi:hypothetical protein